VYVFLVRHDEILGGSPSAISDGVAIASIAQLSQASDAFEISSRRENVGFRIDRMHHQVQQFGDLGLEGWDSTDVSVVVIMGLGWLGKQIAGSPDIAMVLGGKIFRNWWDPILARRHPK